MSARTETGLYRSSSEAAPLRNPHGGLQPSPAKLVILVLPEW